MMTEFNKVTQKEIKGKIFNSKNMFPEINDKTDEALHIYKSKSDSDTIYYHESIKEPDSVKFKYAIHTEVQDNFSNANFSIVPIKPVPEGFKYIGQFGNSSAKEKLQQQS